MEVIVVYSRGFMVEMDYCVGMVVCDVVDLWFW